MAAGTVGGGSRVASGLPNHSSIFFANMLAMKRIKGSLGNNKSAHAEKIYNILNPVRVRMIKGSVKSKQLEYDSRFCWLPSHVRIKKSEEADRLNIVWAAT